MSSRLQLEGFTLHSAVIFTSNSARRASALLPNSFGAEIDLSDTACVKACVTVENPSVVQEILSATLSMLPAATENIVSTTRMYTFKSFASLNTDP